jgi:transposase InsO family protein
MKALKLDGPNHAWCADITYIRLEGGFVYLVAIMDWFSRKEIHRPGLTLAAEKNGVNSRPWTSAH